MWSFQAGTTTANEQGTDVAMDSAGNVLFSMFSSTNLDLGGGSLPAQGKSDVIVAKYAAATGAHLWSRRYGGSGNDAATALTTDAQNNVFVAGSFDSAIDGHWNDDAAGRRVPCRPASSPSSTVPERSRGRAKKAD